jgi:hypothetical protein
MLDACGTSGRDTYSLTGHGGSVHVFGMIRTHARRRPKLTTALRMALRQGHLGGFGDLSGSGTTIDTLTRPGSATCTDELHPAGAYVALETVRRSRLQMSFGPPDTAAESDVLNGRCPGPVEPLTFPGQVLGSATIPLAALARRHLHVVLTRSGPFSSRGYRGTRSGRLELDVRRTHVHVSFGTELVISTGTVTTAQRP